LETSSGINVVDVRDVAEAAVRSVERKVTRERFVLSADFIPWSSMRAFLDDLVQGEVPRVRIPGRVLRGLGRLADTFPAIGRPVAFPLTHEAMTYATRNLVTDGSHATEVLGLEYRPARTTMRDALLWLAAEGHLDQEWPGLVE
jgi:nucleoside-diphosphate-sugar epimerase